MFFFQIDGREVKHIQENVGVEDESLMWIYKYDSVMMLDKINNILKCEKIHTFAEL